MAFEHDQFARFTAVPSPSRNGRPSSVVYPQRPPVFARPPRRVGTKGGDGTIRRRRAQIVVSLKLALLCGWLLHELVVNFDESLCVQIASSSSPPPHPLFFALSPENTTAAKGAEKAPPNNVRRRFFRPIETVRVRTTAPNGVADKSALPSASPFTVGEQSQFHRRTNAKQSVPKRRRKVILRRKLLRKGAIAGDWQQKKKNGNAKSGAVRRVVWRIVPLQRLPPSEDGAGQTAEDGSAEERQNNRWDAFPFENEFGMPSTGGTEKGATVRTKTGTVVVRRTDRGEGVQLGRRMARRRTTAPNDGQRPTHDADATADDALSVVDFLAPNPIALRRLPPFHRSSAVPSLSLAHQLVALFSVGLCLCRAVFDCWALIQCFCCALFLLGLCLRRRPLSLLPLAFDVFSVLLALFFCLSLVVLLLVLSLLAPSVPPPPLSLFRCFLFIAALCFAVILFAFCTFCEQCAVAEMTKKRKRRKTEDKREEEEEEKEEEKDRRERRV
ncbi:hypothetical protein niasHT_014047 [Heterodera trifolii]|uniref:Transmembrane protein n=1 Tax=Heterodera trifolii TaxID=157864 RepID=A0ABD2LG59_9BILA